MADATHPREAALRATLADLADRWDRMADTARREVEDAPADITGVAAAVRRERLHIYRTIAGDLRRALATGRVPDSLVADTEAAPAPALARLDGADVPLSECCWVEYALCGCATAAVTAAHPDGGRPLPTEDDARRHLDTGPGRRVEFMTLAHFRAEITLTARCPYSTDGTGRHAKASPAT